MQLLQKLKKKARELKNEVQVLILAYKDRRTPLLARVLISITIAYLLSPIDLIPDFIPILGLLDDILIVPALITLSIKLIPSAVLREARERAMIDPAMIRKTNWIFAIVIVCIWILLVILIFL